eukprot:PLAT15393.1.p1 GENE.PLAT15393.1~~PLAT15393.1.p1  ORF type:complete len:647 (+),score=430.85 PLAT15393.1:25-1941(+)
MFAADSDQTSAAEKELQAAKFEELTQILLSAGYFRARIPSLSEFDKVVGGLCWSISASGAIVDVDLFFQENSTIGQKIKLAENIVEALRRMKCPFPLQAHQIQGEDFPALFPIIQWLVKKVIEYRELTGDLTRLFSEYRFGTEYVDPSDETFTDDFTAGVSERYGPLRRMKRSAAAKAKLSGLDARVSSVLLEYGERVISRDDAESKEGAAGEGGAAGGGIAAAAAAAAGAGGLRSAGGGAGGGTAFERQLAAAQRAAAEEEAAMAREAAAMQKMLLKTMATVDGDDASLTGSSVAGIVGLQSELIREAAAEYSEQAEEIRRAAEEAGGGGGGGAGGALGIFKRQKAALERQLAERRAEAEAAEEERAAAAAALRAAAAAREKAAKYNARVVRETKKLEAVESREEFAADLAELKALVQLNEALKAQEAAFKASCLSQRSRLTALIAELEAAEGDDEAERLAEIEAMHEELLAKYNKARQLLAKKNQALARLLRKLDDVPARSELIQYERRFVELYEAVAAKLEEHRKFVAVFNSSVTVRDLLSKEATLLESISSQTDALDSRAGREAFSKAMSGILAGLEDTQRKKTAALDDLVERKESLEEEHARLVEKQRRYFAAVKELQDACTKNDQLVAALEG